MSLHVVRLEAENFKRLRAVRIDPEGNVVEIAGKNGAGKSSVLDAIWVALKGRAANPPEPIRQGEEVAYLELDLGKYKITRRFTRQEDGDYTDFLRVEDPEGLQYPKPQQTLDRLLGAIGFDPFAFVQMKPGDQAKSLLQLVPLEVDLAELAALDKRLYDTRRDTNRDLKNAEARLTALPAGEKIDVPDIAALQEQLQGAAEANGTLERRKAHRERFKELLEEDEKRLEGIRERILQLTNEGNALAEDIAGRKEQMEKAEALPEPVDTVALSQRLTEARQADAKNRELAMRDVVAAEIAELRTKSEGFTARMEENAKKRTDALAKAKMPVEGLGVDHDDDGAHVTFNGVPFVQISKGEQLRVSTAIAMAGNPELRILRISDGALLDDDSMAILRDMAAEHDFQLFVELVRPNESTGIILEDGAIVGQELEPREHKPARKKAEPKPAKASDPVEAVGEVEGEQPRADVAELFTDPPQPAEAVHFTAEEWAALPAARRAFLEKKGATHD